MVAIAFTPLGENEFLNIVNQQKSLGLSLGGLRNDINIFKVYRPRQRGGSIFSILSTLGRRALPFLSKYVFPSAKTFAKNVMTDMIDGENFKKTIKKRGKEGL